MKAAIVTDAILYLGMAVISGLLLTTQVPAMINDIQTILSKESVKAQSRELAGTINSIVSASNEIKIIYSFPSEKSYDVEIKNGFVTIVSDNDKTVSKLLVDIEKEFSKKNAEKITISRLVKDGKIFARVE